MGNLKQKRLSVRIAVDDISKGKGTGALFLRNNGEDALIFTVAHLFNGKLDNEDVRLFIDIIGEDNQVFGIHNENFCFFKWSGEFETNNIAIHRGYDKDTLDNDIAILRIKWQDWMREFQSVGFVPLKHEMEVVGWGFPAFMQSKQKIELNEIPSLEAEIRGVIENQFGKSLLINYHSGKVDTNVTRQMEIDGFSGTALFCEGYFAGCVSKPVRNITAGSRIIACSADLYMELMKDLNILPQLPENLITYGDELLSSIPKEKKEFRNYISRQKKRYVVSEIIKPCNYIVEEESGYKKLPCKGIREICGEFWKGCLISAFCFIPLKGIEPEKLPCFSIKTKNDCVIKVVFICTESTMAESIQNLMDYSVFNTSDEKEDGILFLWNNQEDETYYNGQLSKKDSANIVNKITMDYIDSDIEELQDRMNMFHIVDGDNLRCNIASVGIGQIWNQVLVYGDGDESDMAESLDRMIDKVWR